MPRYRFGRFTLSPRQRTLLCDGSEVRLIPRYLDLLIFLVERRHEAVHRREIFERVWSDVIVSDSALAQAIRTLRRALDDDPREPVFIRTVSRHGYQFVFRDIVEEPDGSGAVPIADAVSRPSADVAAPIDAFEPLLQRLTSAPLAGDDDDARREAAEQLHMLGTADALQRLGTRPGHPRARALLRDTRWDVPGAGAVPVFGQPAAVETASALVALRLRAVARLAIRRCTAASLAGGAAGAAAGAIGGVALAAAPGSAAPGAIAAVLALVGGACGAWGGAGVGAGISIAEAGVRSHRLLAVVAGAAAGGAAAGVTAQWVARAALATLVGVHVAVNGLLPGLAIGAAAGAGLASATRHADTGFAAPRGRRRLRAILLTGAACAAAALLLALTGIPLVGGTIHAIAQASAGSEAALTPLSRMLGEPEFGPVTRALIGTGEGAVFGVALAAGLTRRGAHSR